METTTSRRNIRRSKNSVPVVIAVAIVITLAIVLVIVFVGQSSDKSTPAAGTNGAANSANVLLAKALGEMNNGALSQAKTDLVQVSKINPQNKFAYYNLGYIAQTQKQQSDAETQYKLTLAIDPKFDPALYNLGILRAQANDINGAIVLYRQAIASNANDAKAHFNLGLLLRQSGSGAAGNAQVQAAVKISPELQPDATAQGVPQR